MQEEQYNLKGDLVNLAELESEILNPDEVEALKTGEPILHPELAFTVQKDQAKGFWTTTQDLTTWLVPGPSAASITLLIPPYNLDASQMPKTSMLPPFQRGIQTTLNTHGELQSGGGILLTSPIFERVHMTPVDVANLSFYLSQISGQPAITSLPKEGY